METFELSSDIKDDIIKWASSLDIFQKAKEDGYLTMKEDAYIKMLKWYTTLDEIRRVLE